MARVFISYKYGAAPDVALASRLRALLKARGHTPFTGKDAAPGDEWQERIENEIVRSQYFIVLLSRAATGSPMVRAEIEKARRANEQRGKPRLLPVRVGYREDLDYGLSAALDHLQFLSYPDDGDVEQICLKIVGEVSGTRLPERIGELALGGLLPTGIHISEERPLKYQLPPPPRDFVNRKREVRSCVEAVRKRGRSGIVLWGMAGIGKTAAALRIAHELSPDYPDGHIVVNLRHTENSPGKTTAEAMKYIIESLNAKVEEEDADVLTALYMSLLRRQRTIILLDDAAGESDIEPLIPPDGNLLIATSRQKAAVRGMIARELDALTEEDSVKLIRSVFRNVNDGKLRKITHEQARAVSRACFNHPMAVNLAAGALVARPDLPIEELTSQVWSPAELDKRIAGSYSRLPDAQKRLWLLLSVFHSSFDRAAAAAVWGVNDELARTHLGVLLRHSMLEWEQESGRYRLNALLRNFADQQLDEPSRASACRRYAEHYVSVAEAAEPHLTSARRGRGNFMTTLETELKHFQALAQWADLDVAHCELALRLSGTLFWFWNLRGMFAAGLALADKALSAASGRESDVARARALYCRGGLRFLRSEMHQAAGDLMECSAILRPHGDQHRLAYALVVLGMVNLEFDNLEEARANEAEAVRLFEQAGDEWGWALATNDLARAVFRLEGYDAARALLERSRDKWIELGDNWGLPLTLATWGYFAWHDSRSNEAMELLQEALGIQQALGDTWGIAGTQRWLGALHLEHGEYREAAIALGESLSRHLELGRKLQIAQALHVLGKVAFAVDDCERSGFFMGAAEAICARAGLAPEAAAELSEPPAEFRARIGNRSSIACQSAFDAGRASGLQSGIEASTEQALEWAARVTRAC